MSGLSVGWVSFTEFCERYDVKRDGNEYRKLAKLEDVHKNNLTKDETKRAYWLVNESACKQLFGIE